MDLLYFVLTSYGLTQILVYGSVLKPVRPQHGKLGELFSCSMCTGFWTGAFLFGINDFTELFTYEYSIANLFILSCLSSGTSYVLNEIFGDCGLKLLINKGEKDENH